MNKLTATYKFPLDTPLHVHFHSLKDLGSSRGLDETEYFKSPEELTFKARAESYDIAVALKPGAAENPLTPGHQWIAVNVVEIAATTESDIEEISDLGEEAKQDSRRVVYLVLRRLLEFFKYKLGNPLIVTRLRGHRHSEVVWDLAGKVSTLIENPQIFDVFPGASDALGSSELRQSHRDELVVALACGVSYSVIDDMRSNAQASIFEEEFRLAVLQLAMSAEVAIKASIFKRDRISAELFDYLLEEKRALKISPMDIVHKLAFRVFGESFKEVDQDAYEGIETLFRCRNKVVHALSLDYRDQKGTPHTAGKETLYRWWSDVDSLLTWLKTLG